LAGAANRYHTQGEEVAKSLPPFGWDTEAVMGTKTIIEEAFIDVFCDFVYGGGWIDVGRNGKKVCWTSYISKLAG